MVESGFHTKKLNWSLLVTEKAFFCHIFGRKTLSRVGNTEWFPRVLAPNLLIDFLQGRHEEKQAGVVWLLVAGYTLQLKMIVTGKQGLEKELSTQYLNLPQLPCKQLTVTAISANSLFTLSSS
jgi:hypothetical protein